MMNDYLFLLKEKKMVNDMPRRPADFGRPHWNKRNKPRRRLNEERKARDLERAREHEHRRVSGIRKKITEKRRTLRRVATMSPADLASHQQIIATGTMKNSEWRNKVASLSPEVFRKIWMAGLRKSIRELRDLIPPE